MELKQVRPAFVESMDHELEANTPKKGPYAQFTPPSREFCVAWLDEHTTKLKEALFEGNPAKVREYSADVANIVMKIDEKYGSPGS